MKISRKFATSFVACLPHDLQMKVKRAVYQTLHDEGLAMVDIKEATARAMESRLSDLDAVMSIEWVQNLRSK